MPNELTGDFEATVQLRVGVVNMILASLHQAGASDEASPKLLHTVHAPVGVAPSAPGFELAEGFWEGQGCWDAQIDPGRAVADVSDDEALAIVAAARPRMQDWARLDHGGRDRRVHDRAGMPCRRCTTAIRARGQGDDHVLVPRLPALRTAVNAVSRAGPAARAAAGPLPSAGR